MLNGKSISIVIPFFNEEQALPVVLQNLPEYADEVIMVDNCSTDNSADIASRFQVILVEEKERGYGSALLKGIKCTTGDLIIMLDGDGSYSMEDIKNALNFLEDNCLDFISGCRFPLRNSTKAMPLINKLANFFISGVIRVLFKIDLKDSQSGFMILKRHLLNKIAIKNKGMGFSQELKIKAWLIDPLCCAEVPISYNVRIGKSKFKKLRDSFCNCFSLVNLMFTARTVRREL